jgi:hypothetical protein
LNVAEASQLSIHRRNSFAKVREDLHEEPVLNLLTHAVNLQGYRTMVDHAMFLRRNRNDPKPYWSSDG